MEEEFVFVWKDESIDVGWYSKRVRRYLSFNGLGNPLKLLISTDPKCINPPTYSGASSNDFKLKHLCRFIA